MRCQVGSWLSFWSSGEKFRLKIRGSRAEPCAVPHLDEEMRPHRGEIVEGIGSLTLSKRPIKMRLVPIRGWSSVPPP